MRYELKILGLILGLRVSLAQGSKAISGYISKDGVKALSTRFSLGDRPYIFISMLLTDVSFGIAFLAHLGLSQSILCLSPFGSPQSQRM